MKALLTFCILLIGLTVNAQTPISGVWNIGKENTKINIVKDDEVVSATIISSDSPKLEAGSLFLKDVRVDDGKWKGKLYNVKKKKWYNATFVRKNENTLSVKVDAGFISKTIKWTKE